MKRDSVSSSAWTSELWPWNYVWSCYQLRCVGNDSGNVGISQSLHQVFPMNVHTGAERTLYAGLSGTTEPMRWKVTLSWIASLLMRHHVTTAGWSQNSSPCSGDIWIPHQRKCSRLSCLWVTWCALSFEIENGWSFWISWNPDKPSALTVTLWHWLNWRLKLPESDQRRKQPFSCNMLMLGLISVQRP